METSYEATMHDFDKTTYYLVAVVDSCFITRFHVISSIVFLFAGSVSELNIPISYHFLLKCFLLHCKFNG